MANYDVRLVLKAAGAEAGVVSVAMRNRWEMRIMGNRNAEVFVNEWLAPGPVEVRYVEDPLTGIPFVTFRGEHSAEAAQPVERSCDVWEFAEAMEVLRRATDRDERLTAAYAAAFTAPRQPVEELVGLFRSLASDRDPGIRQAVIISTGYVPWPALIEIVRQLAATDEVDHVRENARLLLEGLSAHGDEG